LKEAGIKVTNWIWHKPNSYRVSKNSR
jgi:hypothetical protein